jgi:hypothetical protein
METSLWEILVPRKWNDGKPIRTRHHRQWDKRVRAISGGMTIHPPTIKGEWVSPEGELYVDSTIPVRLTCTRQQIEEIMDFTAKHYRQKAVMAYKVSSDVIIKNYE